MRQHNKKSQANSISHILLNMEMKADYAVLEIPTWMTKQLYIIAMSVGMSKH
jgi:hypothetical protein